MASRGSNVSSHLRQQAGRRDSRLLPAENWVKEQDFWKNHIHADDQEWVSEVFAAKTILEKPGGMISSAE